MQHAAAGSYAAAEPRRHHAYGSGRTHHPTKPWSGSGHDGPDAVDRGVGDRVAVAVGLDKGVLGGIGSDGKLSLVKIDKALVAAVQERQGERGKKEFST